MKKLWILGCLSALLAVPNLSAIQQVETVGGYGPYQTGVGGEFTLHVLNNSLSLAAYTTYTTNRVTASGTTPNFQTFCVEGTEFIYPNALFDVTVGQTTIFTGTGLTVGAAYLYFEFAKGLFNGTGGLPTYDYVNNAGRHTSAGLLQNAIWWLMGQESQTYNASNPFELLAVNTFANPFALNSSLANPISVDVLNLWAPGLVGQQAGKRQDQLILTGNQGYNVVPEGGLTAGLLGMGLLVLGAVRRRIRK